jgi:hypothetical protein
LNPVLKMEEVKMSQLGQAGKFVNLIVHNDGFVGHQARYYLSPEAPENVDKFMDQVQGTGSQIATGVAIVCYWGGSSVVNCTIDGFYGVKGWWRSKEPTKKSDDVEMQDLQKEDEFVMISSEEYHDEITEN